MQKIRINISITYAYLFFILNKLDNTYILTFAEPTMSSAEIMLTMGHVVSSITTKGSGKTPY